MVPEIRTVKLADIVFDEAIYPRKKHRSELVQQYAEVAGDIPF